MTRLKHIGLLLAVLSGATLHAEALKKVLILDVINIDKNPNYDYLVSSITDAFTAKLKENFAYSETSKETWQKAAAAGDLPFEDESYTRTFALSLGLKMRQDIAISGGFRVAVVNRQQVIKTTVFLIDVKNKRIIDTIEKSMPLTGDLFGKVDELAIALTEAAKKVLPGKDYFVKHEADFEVGHPTLRLTTETYFLPIFGARTFDEASSFISPSRMPLLFGGGLRAQAQLWRKFEWYVQGMFYTSFSALKSEQSGTRIPQTLLGGGVTGGVGYVVPLSKRLSFTPWLGGGFLLGQTTLQFSNYERQPVDSTGARVSSQSALFYGPTVNTGLTFGIIVTEDVFLNIGAVSMAFFNGQGVSASLGATVSGAWRF
ncbi:MAG: hypothetical protein J0L53_07700 [Spirochaetes bacterium]|nr:hypothetical protein [Spirochaetota bacterium]MBX3723601.1 hypothetical protein [Turneriella sp.]